MELTFDADKVRHLLAHSAGSTKWNALYNENARPGLWLVGDQGVYLMSNGDPPLKIHEGQERNVVCYANECNPYTLDFDVWWGNKRAAFGGDDGVDFIEAAIVNAGLKDGVDTFVLDLTPPDHVADKPGTFRVVVPQ